MSAPAAAELEFTRVFDAPRTLVFACMTDARHLTHFWGPAGMSAPLDAIRVDPRPGGVFETVMVSEHDGSRYPTRATYLEVDAPGRLVWHETHSGMTVTVTLTELDGDRTEVRIHQTDVPAAALDPAAQAGFRTSLDRFDAYLRQQTGRTR